MIAVLLAFAFVVTSLLFMSACAKKQVQMTEGVQPTEQETTASQESATQPAATEEPKAVIVDQTEENKTAEAEQLEKLQAEERAQREAAAKAAFENEKIYFDFDKSDLKAEAQVILKKKADWLRENPAYSLRIEG
ncbi:MAG: hypothetical protein P8Y00_07705, partial [Deltaproteobacteria bacterium]